MPYFKWSGIDIYGRSRKGKLFCGSLTELDSLLLQRDIAVITSKKIRLLYTPAIRLSDKVQFFTQLGTLLKAGVHLHHALTTLSAQTTHVRLSAAIYDYAHRVQEGELFTDALRNNAFGRDPVINTMMQIGQETGALDTAVESLAYYLGFKDQLFKKIRSTLRLPLITLIFFVVIVLALFTFVIPQFAALFTAAEKELPAITRYILALSTHLKTGLFWGGSVFLVAVACLCWRFSYKSKLLKKWRDALFLHFPFIGTVIYCNDYAHFFKALALLTKHGVPNAKAVFYAAEVIENHFLYNDCIEIAHEVHAGVALSNAVARMRYVYTAFDVLSLIATGQESGNMSLMIDRVADMYHEKCAMRLSWIALLIQPIVMVVLGLLVALLVCAVYLPLLNVSYTL